VQEPLDFPGTVYGLPRDATATTACLGRARGSRPIRTTASCEGRRIPVGPDICTNPEAAHGFYGFHQNIHTGTPNLFAFQQGDNPVGFTAIPRCPTA
jgi:hypothetical protein